MLLRFVVSQLKEDGHLRVVATVATQEEAEAAARRYLRSDPAVYWVSDMELGSTRAFGSLGDPTTEIEAPYSFPVASPELQPRT